MIITILNTVNNQAYKPIYHFDTDEISPNNSRCVAHFFNNRTNTWDKHINIPLSAKIGVLSRYKAVGYSLAIDDQDSARRLLWRLK